MVDADAPRKCAFTVRIDAALEEQAFNAPSFRFRFIDGSKKQTPVVGTAGWTPHPETPACWRFEAVIADVLVTETLAVAIDDDPIVAFVLSDATASSTPASQPAAGKGGSTSARPTTAAAPVVGGGAPPLHGNSSNNSTSRNATSGRGRLVADVLALDASALFVVDCLYVEQTWVAPATVHTPNDHHDHDDDSVFASTRPRDGSRDRHGHSLFAKASGICSVTIGIAVDQPLLAPALRRKLNPLTLTVGTARRLPGVGVSVGTGRHGPHDALAARCRPVYALFHFFPDRKLYASSTLSPMRSRLVVTPGRAHAATVDWQHTTTVLCGRCDAAELYDALHTASLRVELHDRDLFQDADALRKLHAKWESLHATGVDPTAAASITNASPHEAVAGESRHATPRGGTNATATKPLDAFAVDEIVKHDWHALLGRAGESFAFGVAVFRLNELLPKANVLTTATHEAHATKPYMALKITVDVLARKRRAQPIGAAALAEADTDDHQNNGDATVDTPTDKLVREPGAFVASGTTPSLHVTLQHALTCPGSPSLVPSSVTSPLLPRFARFVLLFPYNDTATLTQLMRVLEAANLRVLPDGVSLRSYQLTPQEKRACASGELDVLTGCMVIDDDLRLVVLEGLADGAMRDVHRALPRSKPQSDRFRMYANDALRFTERLYTAFDVDLKRIKLRYALPTLLQMPDIYMRTKVAEPCYAALTQLMEMRRVARLADVKELGLFPTAAMLLEVESKYGESISLQDIHGRKKTGGSVASSSSKANAKHRRDSVDPATQDARQEEGDDDDRECDADPLKTRHASSTYTRLKAPTDATNAAFEAHRKSRQPKDFLDERRKLYDEQQLAFRHKREQEDAALRSDPRASAPVYLYSGQKLRSQDALQDELRKRLATDTHATYTYGPEFQSLAISLVNPDELRQNEEREARKKWTTQRGFVYPAPRPTAEYYAHADAPSEARCEDLRTPFVDNANHPKPVSRDNNRGHDPRPEFSTLPSKDLVFGGTNGDGSINSDYFRSVHLCGEQARREMDEALAKEQADWERKLVVDRSQIKFLAHGNICSLPPTATRGGPATSQLDKLRDILHGPTRSKPLRIVRNATLPSGKRVPLLPPPASILSLQEYAGPVAATFANTLRHNDEGVAFLATDATTGKPKDFHFPSVSNVLTPPVKQHTTHKEIRPVPAQEKHGFLWGNHNQ